MFRRLIILLLPTKLLYTILPLYGRKEMLQEYRYIAGDNWRTTISHSIPNLTIPAAGFSSLGFISRYVSAQLCQLETLCP